MKWYGLLVVAGLALAGPVTFSGSVGVSTEQSRVSGTDSLVEPFSSVTITVNPSISFWGFPLSLDALISTQESNLRQQLDKFRFFLHPSEWVEGMTDVSGLALAVKSVELGSCNPSWSPLVLSDVSVLGAAVELSPWKAYLAGTAGRSQRAVVVSDSTEGAYSRMLYAGKTGYGSKAGTHFYLTGLYANDDPNSLLNNQLPAPGDTEPPIDSFEVVLPQQNYVLGAEFNLLAGDDVFTLESEAAVSELTRDNRLPVEDWDWLPGWVERIFKPRLSSSVDFAFRVRPALNLLNTRLYGELEYVGPGYVSLGAPSVSNDNFAIGAGFQRNLFDRSVSLSAGVSTERDNLLATRDSAGNELRLKSTTTRFTSWETDLSLAFPNLPYLQMGYYPYTERSDSAKSAANVISVSTGHGFQTGSLSHSPSVTVSYNDLRGTDPSGDYTSWDAGVNYGLGFEFPLSLSAGTGYSRSVSSGAEPDTRLYFDVIPSYTAFEVWTNSLNLGASLGSNTRLDAGFSSSFPAWKICDARLGVSYAAYSGTDGKYNDLYLTAELTRSW